MCAAFKVTRQGHCAWKRRPPSAHAMRDEELAELIAQVRAEVRGIYGAPKTFFALKRMGVRTSMKRVARIMRERGWRGVTRACAKRPSGEKRAAKRESAEDLVKRKFSADGPNMAWFADIACVKTRQGWLYLALVMDNAAMESLMGIVKSECVHARVYATRDEAALDIFERIEAAHNRARIRSALGYMSPAEFEKANWPDDEGRPRAA